MAELKLFQIPNLSTVRFVPQSWAETLVSIGQESGWAPCCPRALFDISTQLDRGNNTVEHYGSQEGVAYCKELWVRSDRRLPALYLLH